ncbi:mannan endo-1,6-alpha-mannosidase Dfg5p [[Candida] railenensis]|uniref:Mannan endo-1,6-alpha-mannosidase n=1 Tax=[Candida] railenensis TaxID=45579 RepID=A0A9P0QLY8_9ASCO|nr:mannan endo-1,6-alpha-mannosidase Dfg5p [[Candida] railenensis]
MLLPYIPITLLLSTLVSAVDLDLTDNDSICAAAKAIMDGELNYYEGTKYGGAVGMFSSPYYWWEAGEAFGGILNYYVNCDSSNTTLKELIYNAMYHQSGDDHDYMPSNQTFTEGNDDQGVWGLTSMLAVELNFTDPTEASWLSMTQAIYNEMLSRWDTTYCAGGMRWQIFTWNSGYTYKNTIANGCLFNIAARLGRYLDNDTYIETAEKVWDWMEDIGFISESDGELVIYDGADISTNCTSLTTTKWSYTYGIMIQGCAFLYNQTGDSTWETRAQQIWTAGAYFFNDTIMYETACQTNYKCNTDQRSFRSLFARSLASAALFVPSISSEIETNVKASAAGAAQSCSGGSDGVTCGINWSYNGWDGWYGLGEQMSALEIILALFAFDGEMALPYTATNGGSSTSNTEAGTDSTTTTNSNLITIGTKDKAGAGILTAVVLIAIVGGSIWMVL